MSIAIIGGGMSGLTAGAYLKHQGIEDFLIFEEESEIGGTWRDHNYPGAGTDTEAPSYIPTFLPIPNFHSQFATRDEIFTYMKEVMAKQSTGYERIRLGHRILEYGFSYTDDKWHIKAETASGVATFEARFIILAYFSLSKKYAKIPKFPGQDRFTGAMLHSSALENDLSQFANKDVVVVGCGATAVQLVPSISDVSRSVTVLRRTMPYISCKQKKPPAKTRFGWTLDRYRYELRNDLITCFDWNRKREWLLRRWVWLTQYQLPKLTGASSLPPSAYPHPEQPVQCTRRAFDYLGFRKSLSKPHMRVVDLTKDPVKTFVEEGIQLESGEVCRADLIIFATGYHTGGVSTAVQIMVNDKPVTFVEAPNLYVPLIGCPLFCVPPRAVEDGMSYFVQEYRKHAETARQIYFFAFAAGSPNDGSVEAKALSNHVVFSPHCSSARYFQTTADDPDSRKPQRLYDFQSGVPRFLFNLAMKGFSAFVVPKDNQKSMSSTKTSGPSPYPSFVAMLGLLSVGGSLLAALQFRKTQRSV